MPRVEIGEYLPLHGIYCSQGCISYEAFVAWIQHGKQDVTNYEANLILL
jgi:hypothetical protein